MINTNPVYRREVQTSARTVKLSVLILVFNGILALISFFILNGLMEESLYTGTMEYEGLVNMYTVMSYMEFAMFMMVIPASTSGSISGEKERRTLDMLLTGKMTPFAIVMGKLEASLNMVILLAISSLPVLSLVFLFGGITGVDLLVMLVTLLVFGVFIGSIGILFSTICNKTTTATVLTYSSVVALIGGTYGITYLASHMARAGESVHGVGRLIYIFLMNPAVTYGTMISAQVANQDILKELYLQFAPEMMQGRVLQFWLPISLALQAGTAALLLILSAWILNPLHKRNG